MEKTFETGGPRSASILFRFNRTQSRNSRPSSPAGKNGLRDCSSRTRPSPLAQGQYSLAVLQAATAVELRITQVVSSRLETAGRSSKAIKRYEDKTLGGKLQIPKTDPRSLETYYSQVAEFPNLYEGTAQNLTPLRNKVIHRGYLPSHEEAIEAVKIGS